MSADRMLLLGVTGLWASGCGSLADGDYRGEVLMEISGQVMMDGSLEAHPDLGVAVLWSRTTDAAAPEAQSVVVSTSFPASYEVRMYHPPESTTRLDLFGIEGFRAAVGEIIVYADDDGDDRWTPGEEVVGGAFDATVLWVEDPDVVEQAEFGWRPKPGFNLVQRLDPFSCVAPWNLWLEERESATTNLFVGAFWPASFDWDCDGQPDFEPGVSDDVGCANTPVEGECQQLEALLEADEDVGEYFTMLESDPGWIGCLTEQCPGTVEAARDAAAGGGMQDPFPSR